MRKMERMEMGRTQWGTDPRAAYSSRPTRPKSPASASSKAETMQDPRGGGGNPRGVGADWLAAPSPGAICCWPTHLTQSASRRPHVQPFKPHRRPRGAQVSLERRGEWAGGLPLVRPSAMAALAGPGRLWGSGLEPGARHEGLRGLWGRPLGPSPAWLWARSGCEDLGPAGQGGLRNLLLSAQAAVFQKKRCLNTPGEARRPMLKKWGPPPYDILPFRWPRPQHPVLSRRGHKGKYLECPRHYPSTSPAASHLGILWGKTKILAKPRRCWGHGTCVNDSPSFER